jgi:probable phosphoglycerate mutase
MLLVRLAVVGLPWMILASAAKFALAPRPPRPADPMTQTGLPGTRGRKRVYLMRHGEVSYQRPDGRTEFSTEVRLTDEGVEQARLMHGLLSPVPFDLGVHTGLTRTRQTAELVLAGRGVRIDTVSELREMQAGSIEHLTDDRIDAEFTYGMERAAQPGAGFPGGESFADFQARIVPAFEALVRRPDWTTALVVGHGGTNAVILAWVTRGGLAGLSAFEQEHHRRGRGRRGDPAAHAARSQPHALQPRQARALPDRGRADRRRPAHDAAHAGGLTHSEQVKFRSGRRRGGESRGWRSGGARPAAHRASC